MKKGVAGYTVTRGQAGYENALIFIVSVAFHLIIEENTLRLRVMRCFHTFTL